MLLEASAGIANELAVASSSAAGEQPDANAGAASGWPPVSTMRPGNPGLIERNADSVLGVSST